MVELDTCAAIVLAAGASTRLGQPKQLIVVDGETLLHRTTRLAIQAGCLPVIVVLGRDAATLAGEVEGLGASIVINDEWQTGMASSLKSGLQAVLAAKPHQRRVMILVCDQPKLDASVLRDLLTTHTAKEGLITASRYRSTKGVPAIFSRELFPELLELTGDQGARRIVQLHLEEVASVDFPGGEFDLDTPQDLARLHV
jgi:molybdenum cofactor cytidylyltransferase